MKAKSQFRQTVEKILCAWNQNYDEQVICEAAAEIEAVVAKEFAEKQKTIEDYAYNLDQFRKQNDELSQELAALRKAVQNLVRIRRHIPSQGAMADNRTDGGSIVRSLRYDIDDIDKAWRKAEQALAASSHRKQEVEMGKLQNCSNCGEPQKQLRMGPLVEDFTRKGPRRETVRKEIKCPNCGHVRGHKIWRAVR